MKRVSSSSSLNLPRQTNEALDSLHHECDPDVPNGCMRCGPKQGSLCCDLHNPAAFAHLTVPAVKSARQPACSSIVGYEASETDSALRHDLDDWRCKETEKVYGKGHLRNLGPGLIMGAGVRDRIVDCAHFSKIQTEADLEKETKWGGSSEFNAAVIDLIQKHHSTAISTSSLPAAMSDALIQPPAITCMVSTSSLPAAMSDPLIQPPAITFMPHANPMSQLSQNAQNGITIHAKARRRPPKCSLCHEEGHTSTFICNYLFS